MGASAPTYFLEFYSCVIGACSVSYYLLKRGNKLKKCYTVSLGAFICAVFGSTSVFADIITTRQEVTSGNELVVNADLYQGINNPGLDGGAIWNAGTLTVNQGSFTGNVGKNGGAIYNSGATVITGGTFSGNTGRANGGAIYSSGTLTINSSAARGVLFENNKMVGNAANDIYLAGVDAANRTVLNLNAYDAQTHNIQLNGGIAGEYYDININGNAGYTGRVVVGNLTGASNLTISAGELVVLGGANNGQISGTGTFVVGNGSASVTYNNAGFISAPVNVAANGTLSTDAHFLHSDVVNNGVLQLNDASLSHNITGGGITRINGTVSTSATIANSISILSGKSLTATSANLLSGTVANSGTLTLNGGTLSTNITGVPGQTVIDGTVIAASSVNIQNAVTINSGKSLQINAYGLHGAVDNSGTLFLGDGTLARSVSGTGTTHISGVVYLNDSISNAIVIDDENELTANADNIGGDLDNQNGTLFLTGGALGHSVSGAGNTHITNTVEFADNIGVANVVTVDASNQLTANASAFQNTVTNQAGILTLNGGLLSANITGAGSTHIVNDVTVNADVANDLYLDNTSVTTFDTSGAITDGGRIVANGGGLSFIDDVIDTIDLQQIDLQQNMNVALDLNLADLTSDVFSANYDTHSAANKWVIVSKLNLMTNTTNLIDDDTTLHIVDGTIGSKVKLADNIEFVNAGDIASVLLGYNYNATTGGDIKLSYATIEDAVTSAVASDKTIVLGQDANVNAGAALVGDSLVISGANHSVSGNNGAGISVSAGQTLTMSNVAQVSGFTNTVINNGGSVSLSSVNFATAETTDIVNNSGVLNLNNVQINAISNDGALNLIGGVVLNGDITGMGDLLVDSGSMLNLGGQAITQDSITVNGRVQTSVSNLGHLTAGVIGGDGVLELLDVRASGLYDLFEGVSTLPVDAGALFNTTNTASGVLVEIKPADEIVMAYDISTDAANTIVNLANTTDDGLVDVGVRMRDELLAGNTGFIEQVSDSLNPETGSVVESVNTVARNVASSIANTRDIIKSSRAEKGVAIWTQGIYAHTKQNDMFGGNMHGVSGGLVQFDANKLFGLGYSFGHSDILTNSRDIDADASTLFLYGQYRRASWYANAMLNYTVSDFTEDANISGIKIVANYDAKSYGAQIMTGYDFTDGMTPEIGLQYMHMDIDAYKNSLGVKNSFESSDYLTFVLGTKYAHDFDIAGKVFLQPQAHYALKYDMLSDTSTVTVSMPDVASYTLDVERLSRMAGELGIGLSAKYRGFNLSLNYDLELRDGYSAQYGRVKLKYNF